MNIAISLQNYLNSYVNTKYKVNYILEGGYLVASNSNGKTFEFSVDSLLSATENIYENINIFAQINEYAETAWRTAGDTYFKNSSIKAAVVVQTRPVFSTLAKIIYWANDVKIEKTNDNFIDLNENSLLAAIQKLKQLLALVTIKKEIEIIDRSGNFKSLPKPFLLLAGISGTGKSRFVRKQAEAHGVGEKNFALVAVRPDWHEPSDLLGYVSRIGVVATYVATDFLKFLVRAWVGATTSGCSKDGLVYKAVDDMVPHWLCLDEMNLAPVEQYFSDYLAVIESRQWLGGQYSCGSLLQPLAFQGADVQALRTSLGIDDAAHDGLWAYFSEHGIAIPPNLIVAGTVNMDETTHGFSRKVLDRAFTIDFGAFYPNDFSQYFNPTTTANTLTFPVLSQVTQPDLAGVVADPDGAKSTAFLKDLNDILVGTPFELAFRAMNELLIAVVCFNPKNEIELQAVWDDFLMTKVLPRIAGDMGKLSAGQDTSVLQRLSAMLGSTQLAGIWQGGGELTEGGVIKLRPDFLRTDSATGQPCQIACRTEAKMAWMQARLEANSFTSFWP